ncbi:MAG: hypothetical protein GQ562_05760 [Anaerolineales bacterium]|nr:hypothetical protein [Anaerolineales bacterium]
MRKFTVFSLVFCLWGLSACAGAEPLYAPPGVQGELASYEDLARHYAPVIRQGAITDQDYITAVNFDGDWVGNNNWENQPTGDLSAYVYYSVIETETHWILFYSLFHPRDYTYADCRTSGGCHENDLGSIQLVVEKDGTRFGQPKTLETLTHDAIYLYTFDETVESNFLKVTGMTVLEGDRPVVYVEALHYDVYGHAGSNSLFNPVLFRGGVVIYQVGDEAEVPQSVDDEHVYYELIPIYDTLWPRRNDIGDGRAFDEPFVYREQILPKAIDGDDFYKDRAYTPWGYYQTRGEGLSRGDWFLDPAKALVYHASFSAEFSLKYLYNPFLVDLGLLPEE